MKQLLGAVFVNLLLSGCATQSFDINQPVGPADQATLDTSQPFFISGLGRNTRVDAAEVCGGAGQVARVETEMTVLDSILGGVTFGIYTPRTARVYCLP